MGLGIVEGVVKEYGFTLEIEPREDEGTKVLIYVKGCDKTNSRFVAK